MPSWSVFFFVAALVAVLLGFSGLAGAAAGIATYLSGVFLVLFMISFVVRRRLAQTS
jgi:uncharacterized membrane protein YtjA (UPF0391 family)